MNTSSSTRCHRQRGAVLVELAMVIPMLVGLVVMGLELGLVLRDQMTVAAATRSGARVGSSVGRARLADYDVLEAVRAGLGRIDPNDIRMVVVFEPDGAGDMPGSCRTVSVAGTCNHYSGAAVRTLVEADFTGVNDCDPGSPDEAWCPTDRVRNLTAGSGPDWLGVYVEVEHYSTAARFVGDRTISDKVVMRLEPRFSN